MQILIQPFKYICHRHPEYWDDPERFKPERFESVDVKDIDPYLYFPFGAGPRRCVGFHLALLEAQFILLQIAQRYYFRKESQNNITLKPGFVLSVQKPFYVRITARNE